MNNTITKLKQQIVFLVCCFSFLFANSQPSYLSEKAEISVLTCGVGNEMYTLFGHTALRVKDYNQNLDVVYNWGMFDFRTPNFYSKFIKGDLLYYLDVSSFNDFIYNYTIDKREVIEQELNLSYEQKTIIWNEINRQLKSTDRYYTYGFIRNNCTTKVVDVLNKVSNKPLDTNFPSNNFSYRYILNEGLNNNYFEKLGINMLFGYNTNKQTDLIFLPIKLKDGLSFNKVLIKTEKKLNTIPTTVNNFSLNSVYTLWIIVCFVTLFSFKQIAQKVYFFTTAIFCLFLLAVSIYTNHEELHLNIWVIFYNPFFIIGLLCNNKKIIFLGTILSVISLIFIGLVLLKVATPLIVLHLTFVMALFLTKNKQNSKIKITNV